MTHHLKSTTLLLYCLIKIYATTATTTTTTSAMTTPMDDVMTDMTTRTATAVENTTSDWPGNMTASDWSENSTASNWSGNTPSDWPENASSDWPGNANNNWSGYANTSDWSENKTSDWSGTSTTSHWSENTRTEWPSSSTSSDWSENNLSHWSENTATSDWPETTTAGSFTPDMLGNFTSGWPGETKSDWSSNATTDWSENSIYNITSGWFKPDVSETSGNATTTFLDKDSSDASDRSKSTQPGVDNMVHTDLDLRDAIEGQAPAQNMNYSLTIPEIIYTADYNKSDLSTNTMISSFLENIHPDNNYTNTQEDLSQTITTMGGSAGSNTSLSSQHTFVSRPRPTSPVSTSTQTDRPPETGDNISGTSSRLISDVTTPSGVRGDAGIPPLPPMTTEFFAITISLNGSLPTGSVVTTSPISQGSGSEVNGSLDSSGSNSSDKTTSSSIPSMTSTSSSSSSHDGEMTSAGEQQQQQQPARRPTSVLLEVISRPFLSRNGYLGANSVTGGGRLRNNRLLNSFQRDRSVPPGLRHMVGRLANLKSWPSHHHRRQHNILTKNYHSNRIVEIVNPPLPPHLIKNHSPSNNPDHHPLRRPPNHRKQQRQNAPDVIVTSGSVRNEADEQRPRQTSSKPSPVSHQKQDDAKTLSTDSKTKSTSSLQRKESPLPTRTTKIGIPQLVITVTGEHAGLGKLLGGVLKVPPHRHVQPESSRRRFYLRRFGRPRPWSSVGSLSRLRMTVG